MVNNSGILGLSSGRPTPTHIKCRYTGKSRSSLQDSHLGPTARRPRSGSPMNSPERGGGRERRDLGSPLNSPDRPRPVSNGLSRLGSPSRERVGVGGVLSSSKNVHGHSHAHHHHSSGLGADRDLDRGRDRDRGVPSNIVDIHGHDSPSPYRDRERIRRDPSPRDPPPDSSDESVCNYDTNVTTLYELLESSNWEKARSRCRTHPQEVRTWIVRRDEKNQRVRWKLLPLHAAVIFQCPTFVVSALIDHYPGAVSRRDDQGMLPLHLAFRYKESNEDLLELLLVQYPKGVHIKDKRDRTPLDHGRGSQFSDNLLRIYAEAVASAAGRGNGSGKHHGHSSSSFDDEIDRRINVLSTDYDNKTKTLKTMYEERIKTLHDKNEATIAELQISAQQDKKMLQDQHERELEELRDMMSSEVGKDGELIADMQAEINQLRRDLEETRADRDSSSLACNEVKRYIDSLQHEIQSLLHDQENLQMLVTTQQQELENSRSRREQLLQSLLRDEKEDSNTRADRERDIFQSVEALRSRMEKSLANLPRHADLFSSVRGRMESTISQDTFGNNKGGTTHRFLAQMKDDISAITENSNF